MNVRIKKSLSVAALSLLFVLPALADNRPASAKYEDEQKTLADASQVYQRVISGTHGKVPQSVIDKTKCIAVFPNIVTAALVVGGSHGNGIASCKDNKGAWSKPAFFNLTSGSVGVQIGGKSTDLVLFLTSNEAANKLKQGHFTLGADASVVAGQYDKMWSAPADAGVIAYQNTDGAFVGASIDGINLGPDKDDNKEFYGKDIEVASILDGTQTVTGATDTNRFTSLLPPTA